MLVNWVAILMNISLRTVTSIWRSLTKTGSCARTARSGRSKKITLREDRVLKCAVKCMGEGGGRMEQCRIYQKISISLIVRGCVSYHRVGELIIVDGTMKGTDYIDIRCHNLLDSVGNIFGDTMIPFIFQHGNAPAHTARQVQT